MPPGTKLSTAQSDSAATMLSEFWQKGFDSLERRKCMIKKNPSAYVYGTKLDLLGGEAEAAGLNPDTMKKAWRAASLFKKEEIMAICSLIRLKKARFSRSHLMRVMAIRDRTKRERMIQQAITDGWGVTELERAIQVANGPRADVGNRPKIPAGSKRLLADLLALTTRWERWCKAAGARIPSYIEPLMNEATVAIGKIRVEVAGRLAKKSPKPAS